VNPSTVQVECSRRPIAVKAPDFNPCAGIEVKSWFQAFAFKWVKRVLLRRGDPAAAAPQDRLPLYVLTDETDQGGGLGFRF
jgi:hypothetical protein